jgi:hypothetical protein
MDRAVRILARPESIAIPPFGSREVVFQMVDEQGAALPDRVLQFAIVDDPMTPRDEARGATLSLDRSVTGQTGTVVVQIIAGSPATFRIRATASRARAVEVVVFVTTSKHSAVEVAPVVEDDVGLGPPIATVRVHVISSKTCAGLAWNALPASTYPVQTIDASATARYASLSVDENHAVVGLGMDAADLLRAAGCVDFHGAALIPEQIVRLLLPLHGLVVAPEGIYAAITRLELPEMLKDAAAIGAPWQELSACAMDPARLWLDCALDALHSDASDPLDCRPSASDNTTPLGLPLELRRGRPQGTNSCRAVQDSAGRDGLELLVQGLFPSPPSTLLADLPTIAAEARQILNELNLESTLVIKQGAQPDEFTVDHRLRIAEFPLEASAVRVNLLWLGAPVLEAQAVPAFLRNNDLTIGTHGFTLRLGRAARVGFTHTSLRSRGVPADIAGFVNTLFALAVHNDKGSMLSGCAAFDAVLCREAGASRGCFMPACQEGLAALARRLDTGFQALDGKDLDLFLSGSVPVVDGDGDGKADALGVLPPSATVPGLWSGELRTQTDRYSLTGNWNALPPP